MIRIEKTACNFVREKLIAPFGFKGDYVTEVWHVVAKLESQENKGIGLGVLSPLWSDSNIFGKYGQVTSNTLMLLIMEYALKKLEGISFENPIGLLEDIYPDVYEYAQKITCSEELRKTYVLNALVAIDNAAWQLYSFENDINNFDDMIPEEYRFALKERHSKVVGIPLITYGITVDEILEFIKQGCFFLKIKIGADPDKDGDVRKMIEWDKRRISEIHEAIKDIKTPYMETGHIPYYLDANGRYKNKEDLMKLINHMKKIGALDRVMILEEPFDEKYLKNVKNIPVRLASDESAHSDIDVVERINLGYGAIALKPIAKTLSMTLKILKEASQKGIPCFCADLTVNPVMVDWNKNVAARIKALPGMNIGVLESNGHQNYINWDKMIEHHPISNGSWIKTTDGFYNLNDDFYKESGGIFKNSEYYMSLVE